MGRMEAIVTAFIAIWPDSSISVLSYPSGHSDEWYEASLYDDLDQESDPVDAKVYRLPAGFHLQTDVVSGRDREGKEVGVLAVTSYRHDGKRPKRMHWSPDAPYQWMHRVRMRQRESVEEHKVGQLVATYKNKADEYPPVPAAVFTVEEIRKMESFSGVYIAINEESGVVEYVGKSCDVTKRVSSARPELKDCRIAVVKMDAEDIHFAELHYIALCKPRRNRVGGGKSHSQEATDGTGKGT